MSDTLKNHLLVAMPSLIDSFFYHSVVYLCDHDQDGAMGMIINRPTRITMNELFQHLKIQNQSESAQEMPVLFGGPVQKEQGMVLHQGRGKDDWKSTLNVDDDLFLTTSSDILSALGTKSGPEKALVTLGYAGWEAGQLEEEIRANSWLTVPADPRILFDVPAEERWQKAARQIGVDIHMMSQHSGRA